MKLVSIDTHIQNKGIYLGHRQVLLDFAFSNTAYDHPVDPKVLERAKDHAPEEVFERIQLLTKAPHQAICFGGGEPLLQVEFIKPLLEKKMSFPLYMETNGTLPKNLAEVKDAFDMFAISLKPDFIKDCIESILLVQDKKVFVRLVASKDVTPKNAEQYAKMISEINTDIPLIIEPLRDCKEPMPLQAMALRFLSDVRVIPAVNWGGIHA